MPADPSESAAFRVFNEVLLRLEQEQIDLDQFLGRERNEQLHYVAQSYVETSDPESTVIEEVLGFLNEASTVEKEQLFEPATNLGEKLPFVVVSADQRLGEQIGEFRLVEYLGGGGMGVVYRAERIGEFAQTVAIKLLKGTFSTPEERNRFLLERQTLADLQHPNIVRLVGGGTVAGQPYLVMDYLADASPLHHFCDRSNWGWRERVAIFIRVVKALGYAHERNVLHRDLKPENILVTLDGTPYLTDFGLARRVDQEGNLTGTHDIRGTPEYMAPEQTAADSRRSHGWWTDIHALGAILYRLCAGRTPFQGLDIVDIFSRIQRAVPAPLPKELPRDLDTICQKCLEKEPTARYASAVALSDDLERLLEGKPILARPVGRGEKAYRWIRRNPIAAGLLGAITLASSLIVGIILITGLLLEAREARKEADAQRDAADRLRDTAEQSFRGEKEARGEADRLRGVAEKAFGSEKQARGEAEKAFTSEKEVRRVTDKLRYYSSVQYAYQSLRSGRVLAARELLEKLPEELRNWEWDFVHRLAFAEKKLPIPQNSPKGLPFTPEQLFVSPSGRYVVILRTALQQLGPYALCYDSRDESVKWFDSFPSQPDRVFFTTGESEVILESLPLRKQYRTSDLVEVKSERTLYRVEAMSADGKWLCEREINTGKNHLLRFRFGVEPPVEVDLSQAKLLGPPVKTGNTPPVIERVVFSGTEAKPIAFAVTSGGGLYLIDPRRGNSSRLVAGSPDLLQEYQFAAEGKRLLVLEKTPALSSILTPDAEARLPRDRFGKPIYEKNDHVQLLDLINGSKPLWREPLRLGDPRMRWPLGKEKSDIVMLSGNGERLVTLGENRTILIRDARTQELLGQVAFSADGVQQIRTSTDGRRLFAVGNNGEVLLWNLDQAFASVEMPIAEQSSPKYRMPLPRDAQYVLTAATPNDEIECIDLGAGTRIKVSEGFRKGHCSIDYTMHVDLVRLWRSLPDLVSFPEKSPGEVALKALDGAKVFTGTINPEFLLLGYQRPSPGGFNDQPMLNVWDRGTGKEKWSKEFPSTTQFLATAIHPEQPLVALLRTGQAITTVSIYDLGSGKELFAAPARFAKNLRFNRSASMFSLGGSTGLQVWDWKAAKKILDLSANRIVPGRTCFSADGSRLAVEVVDGVELYDLASGERTLTIAAPHSTRYGMLSFTTDGNALVALEGTTVIHVWRRK